MKKKNKLFLVGNAHLDPIWQWRWQEGSAEAKATIRSALDRMKEFPQFRFVCSSASVYQWIEEFAPDMFEEIKQRIQEGRFIVVNGWHVQPDCNLPSGEGFVRQSLYSQRYFKEKFGVMATVGYNVDSFGHNYMLPQILRKSGMKDYIFMRPGPHEKDMDSDIFNWVSPDGSSVLTYRILDPYCFNFSDEEALKNRLAFLDEKSRTDLDMVPFFYGVGNHGGGPTIRNLEVLREFAKNNPEYDLTYSDITDFFDAVRSSGAQIPEHHDDLQHHASGCYSTVSHVKNGVRRAETSLIAAEAFHALASALCKKKPINEKLAEAWRKICFIHFHDSMDGCSILEGHEDTRNMYGFAQQVAAETENNALQTISWAVDTSNQEYGVPVFVFNPNSFDVEELVQINAQFFNVVDHNGTPVPCQLVHSSAQECMWRKDTLFKASVPAMGYAVYYVSGTKPRAWESGNYNSAENVEFDASPVTATPFAGVCTSNNVSETVLENEYLRVSFELYSGYITSIEDKQTGEKWNSGRAAVPVVIDEYYHDTWSHAKNFFTDAMARFSDATVTVVENGPLRATVKVVSRYNDSVLTQYFSLAAGSKKLSVRASVDWHEKHKMLKLAWPMNVQDPKAFYEIPFGVIERPADGEEEPGQTWTAVKGTNGGFALLNNNTYSSSVNGNTIYHTVLRSPIYGDHGGPRDEESIFTSQGEFAFSYELMPVADSWAPVIQAAKQLNKPVANIIENWHEGYLKDLVYSGLSISQSNVVLSACKRSEDNAGQILRLYEVDGKQTQVTVSGPMLSIPLEADFGPYSVNTYFLADGAAAWEPVLMTEYPEE